MKNILVLFGLLASSYSFACLPSVEQVVMEMDYHVDHVNPYRAERVAEEGMSCFPASNEIKKAYVELLLIQAQEKASSRMRAKIVEKIRAVAYQVYEDGYSASVEEEILAIEEEHQRINDNLIKYSRTSAARSGSIFNRNRPGSVLNGWIIFSTYGGYAVWVKDVHFGRGVIGRLSWYRFADPRYDYVLNSACPPGAPYWRAVPRTGVYRRGNYNRGYNYICSNPWRWGYYNWHYGYPGIWLL